jgi:pantoate--beta-alanine ligase
MKIVRTAAEARRWRADQSGARVGFVPTMGALHEGHLSLMRAARADCDRLVASVFVNPLQFDDRADLDAYPDELGRDVRAAETAGVDLLFVPAVADIYPADHVTRVTMEGPARGFEGESRPGHFQGVATVCLILFHIVRPAVAWFGQKDAQQVAVIRRLVDDLAMDLDIAVGPTIRDGDGVALSSRNARLSTAERDQARRVPRALEAGLEAHAAGRDPAAAARAELADLGIEYVGVADLEGHPTLVVAVRVGTTRLIDNVPLDEPALAGL